VQTRQNESGIGGDIWKYGAVLRAYLYCMIV